MRRSLLIAGIWIALASPMLLGRQSRIELVNQQQIGELPEYAVQPAKQIRLFIRDIEQRAREIHRLAKDSAAQNRSAEMHNLYEEFTRISDELEDNMESYNGQHADLRKELKEVLAKSEKWTAVLNEPKQNADYDAVRKTALDASRSVQDEAKRMLDDQAKFFSGH